MTDAERKLMGEAAGHLNLARTALEALANPGSGMADPRPPSQVCREDAVQNCGHCDDLNCGDNLRKPAPPEAPPCPPRHPSPCPRCGKPRMAYVVHERVYQYCPACNAWGEKSDSGEVLSINVASGGSRYAESTKVGVVPPAFPKSWIAAPLEPLPCPFCGCVGIRLSDTGVYECCACHARAKTEFWNRRQPCRECEWKQGRLDALQTAQKRMRDPERTMVCDILANGTLLVPEGDRYALTGCRECARLKALCEEQNDTNRKALSSLREANAALELAKLDADRLGHGLARWQGECALKQLQTEAASYSRDRLQARAEAAETRCREAAKMLREWRLSPRSGESIYNDDQLRAIISKLEG